MEAVASSIIRIFGWCRRARARQVSWLWPREKEGTVMVDIGVVRGGEGDVVCVFCSLWSLVEFGTDGLKACPGFDPEDDEVDWVRWTCGSTVYISSPVQSLKES